MSDIGEAVGTAVEGGLFAKAIGGKGGQVSDKDGQPLEQGHFAERTCLNCGTELIGSHCHACGQKAHLHRTLRAFLHDLLHGALHFEGKTWKTLPKLALKPGELTRRYIEGERARFVSPMALFLFSIFLMFAVFQFAGITTPTDLQGDNRTNLRDAVAAEVENKEEQIARIDRELADEDADLDASERRELEAERESLENELAILTSADTLPFLDRGDTEEPAAGEDDDDATVIPVRSGDGPEMKMKLTGTDWIDGGLEKWRKQPALMLYKLQTNFYKFSWLLIPISIPFVWLLFVWKRRFKAYDHAIFVTYSLSFMTLLILTLVMLAQLAVPMGLLVWAGLLIPPIHIYKHLRGTYALSRFSAFWRLCVLTVFITIILTLFLQALVLLGLF